MTRMHSRLSFISVLTLAALTAACVDGGDLTSAPQTEDTTEDPLALTFDALSGQSAASGDRSRSEGFAYAAIAVRRGVQPSRLDVTTDNGVEIFDAFVSALEWDPKVSLQLRAPAHRTVIAWRRTNNGLTRILTLTTPIDSAAILNPSSLSFNDVYAAFFAGASAQYQETTAPLTATGQMNAASAPDAFWAGIRGFVKVREISVGPDCQPRTNDQVKGVTCEQGRYAVKFDVALKRLASRPVNVQTGSAERHMSAAEQLVNGVRLRLSCAVVASRSGCS